ncbi:acetoin utilization protein AcuC [Phytoactinopolyspora limicola]|uniref:acetoin utilization protein AcuC n=1 Tax=Phytoactinopolyspora limicola TaxID=2715536 RepID=UPI00140C2238|nr:acetoin utilization protein AcuC [Phytoactinopolyspora limicola]
MAGRTNQGGTTLHVAWDDALIGYDFGRDHPMNPLRLALTIRLAREMGVLDGAGVQVVAPPLASDELLATVHTADFIEAVRAASVDPTQTDLGHGLGTDDVPCFAGMHDVSARIVGGTVAAARAVWAGAVTHGVNVAGGLHHAMPAAASGFCVYNDVAVGIQAMLDAGAERVAYVDVDVHHGDGVQAVFYDDPRVLTISLHESPRTLFPGTGFPDETGGPAAEGGAVNVALPPGTGDAGWLRAFHAVVPQVLRSWQPQVLVSQHGCDSHADDPLAHLALTVDGQRASYVALHALAAELCDHRWLATGGGGYALVDVVPRAWTHLLAIAAGAPIPPETPVPAGWREFVRTRLLTVGPARMTDGADGEYVPWENGYDPADALDRAIMATRSAVFPWHGLDPHY